MIYIIERLFTDRFCFNLQYGAITFLLIIIISGMKKMKELHFLLQSNQMQLGTQIEHGDQHFKLKFTNV